MTRRKYEITARMNERDYPHMVELALPLGAFEHVLTTCRPFTASATFKFVAAKDGMTTVNSMCDSVSTIPHMPMHSVIWR
jgi:hypothetical protein